MGTVLETVEQAGAWLMAEGEVKAVSEALGLLVGMPGGMGCWDTAALSLTQASAHSLPPSVIVLIAFPKGTI